MSEDKCSICAAVKIISHIFVVKPNSDSFSITSAVQERS